MKLEVPIKHLVTVAFGIFLFGSFQGGLYYPKFKLQELGLLCCIILYAYAVFHSSFNKKNMVWEWWTFIPLLLSLFIIVAYGVIFAVNTGSKPMPSILASRYFLIILIAPSIYLLYKMGYSIEQFEKTIITLFVILLANYMFNLFTADLRSWYFSPDHSYSSLVTFDEWRGFRLKGPTYPIFLVMIINAIVVFQKVSGVRRTMNILSFGVCIYILSIIMTRAALGALIIICMIYPFFFMIPKRTNFFVFCLPMGMMIGCAGVVVILPVMMEHMKNDWSFIVRMQSWAISLNVLKDSPFLGFGQASYYSISYQALFGAKFFPSDLGIIGAAFKYGLIGVFLYMFFWVYTLQRLLRVNWAYQKVHKKHNPLICSIFLLLLSLIVNIMMQAPLVFASGLTLASLSVGLTSCYFDEYGIGKKQVTTQV